MNGFERLLQCRGTWVGHNRLQPRAEDPVSESPSVLTVTPVLAVTFVRLDQEWSWDGKPQSGSVLVGYTPDTGGATLHWVDTWHNGRGFMNLVGQFETENRLVARGSFPVDGSPDWGWRIEIEIGDAQLSVNMFCINPANSKDEGWVWSNYTRS